MSKLKNSAAVSESMRVNMSYAVDVIKTVVGSSRVVGCVKVLSSISIYWISASLKSIDIRNARREIR